MMFSTKIGMWVDGQFINSIFKNCNGKTQAAKTRFDIMVKKHKTQSKYLQI